MMASQTSSIIAASKAKDLATQLLNIMNSMKDLYDSNKNGYIDFSLIPTQTIEQLGITDPNQLVEFLNMQQDLESIARTKCLAIRAN
jgi:hypothetical protein